MNSGKMIRGTGSTIPFEGTGWVYETREIKVILGHWSENAA
jgi:hypothetical protein